MWQVFNIWKYVVPPSPIPPMTDLYVYSQGIGDNYGNYGQALTSVGPFTPSGLSLSKEYDTGAYQFSAHPMVCAFGCIYTIGDTRILRINLTTNVQTEYDLLNPTGAENFGHLTGILDACVLCVVDASKVIVLTSQILYSPSQLILRAYLVDFDLQHETLLGGVPFASHTDEYGFYGDVEVEGLYHVGGKVYLIYAITKTANAVPHAIQYPPSGTFMRTYTIATGVWSAEISVDARIAFRMSSVIIDNKIVLAGLTATSDFNRFVIILDTANGDVVVAHVEGSEEYSKALQLVPDYANHCCYLRDSAYYDSVTVQHEIVWSVDITNAALTLQRSDEIATEDDFSLLFYSATHAYLLRSGGNVYDISTNTLAGTFPVDAAVDIYNYSQVSIVCDDSERFYFFEVAGANINIRRANLSEASEIVYAFDGDYGTYYNTLSYLIGELVASIWGADGALVLYYWKSGWVERQPKGNANGYWNLVASDAEGHNLIAVEDSGRLYISSNFGVTWIDPMPAGNKDSHWDCIDISSNGSCIVAGEMGGRLWLSTDGGSGWAEIRPAGDIDKSWSCVVLDDNIEIFGTIIIAGENTGRLYRSINGGSDWLEIQPAGNFNKAWSCVAINGDGYEMLAAVGGINGRIYASHDQGANWLEIQPAGNSDKAWISAASDRTDDTRLVGITPGRLYLSNDGDTTWIETKPAGNIDGEWLSICIGGDGKFLMVSNNKRIYVSSDSGVTWHETRPAGDQVQFWRIAGDSDGSNLIAGIYNGRLYTRS